MQITVANEPSAEGRTRETTERSGVGYGLSGMAERAELIGAHLSAGPDDGAATGLDEGADDSVG